MHFRYGDFFFCLQFFTGALQVGFEPSGEIHRQMGGRYADVRQVAGTVSCGNIHAAAECNGKMRVVTADPGPLLESLPGRLGRARMLVTEGDVVVYVVADGLYTSPSGR